jgi:hypothetical protein
MMHGVVQIPHNMPVATLLVINLLGKCFSQSRFSVIYNNTSIRKLNPIFPPMFVDVFPTFTSPEAQPKELTVSLDKSISSQSVGLPNYGLYDATDSAIRAR